VTEEYQDPFFLRTWFWVLMLAIGAGFIVWTQTLESPESTVGLTPCTYYQGEPFHTPCIENGKVRR
jgi:hypothetical protein